jgi:cellulose synthase/poly-beta-1,6-N-acetylglucosamine synthase-like glycosyltransferase
MKVSIGITAHNEEKNMGKLLERLSKEKFSFNLKEIIVVASGCTDKTEEIVREHIKKSEGIKLIPEIRRMGKSSAVNIILKKAKGDVIVFICADNIPKKSSINELVRELLNERTMASTGRPIPLENKNTLFGYISHFIWILHHEICLESPKISGELFAIRRGIVDELPYNIINDDGYFTSILRKKDYKISYVKRAVTYMIGKNSLLYHIRRRRRIARGYMQLKEIGLEVSIPYNIIISSIYKKIKKNPKNSIKILFIIILEIIINIFAYYDTLVGKTPYCWDR